ncbi:MAG: helix-turn-helix domain-containing protein [Paenisporosarcina sp.]
MIIDEDQYLVHYGTKRHSGRYAWGSGGNEEGSGTQRNPSLLDFVSEMRARGLTDKEIADGMGLSTTELRARRSIALAEKKQSEIAMAQRLRDKGYSHQAIADRMGLAGESSVRALLVPGAEDRAKVLTSTADMLQRVVDEKTYVDVGLGSELYVGSGISKEKLGAAVAILQEKGYELHTVPVLQPGTGKETKVKVLAPPGTTWGDVRRNQDNIKSITEFSEDGGRSYNGIKPPLAIKPNRVAINYKEDGGDQADGVIYLRPGVDDLSLGGKMYAQVRVQVGPDHYLKGMAMYKDDLPAGTDIVFNTNKSSTGNKLDAMKKLERDEEGNVDPDLPFGSIVRQILDKPGHPDAKPTSAMNLVNDEEDWAKWNKSLSSQMLSKQSPALAKSQLGLTYDRRKTEFDDIMALTNPTVKKTLLEEFAGGTDSAAVHLKAAALPRQATHVILPLSTIKPTEIYAPGYNNGEKVVLIRYPHGGTFEIPELTVNNKNREGRKHLGSDARVAVGIHADVAKHLSGADFDGDTVLVIPNVKGPRGIKTSPALEGLKDFDPHSYKIPDGSPIPRMKKERLQQEMGLISNLITDMTIQGASHDQLARAVKHSMVVIDSVKHGLNYKQSAQDNGIAALKEQYQGSKRGGAATLISKKKRELRQPETRLRRQSEGGPIDPKTGARVFVPTGRTFKSRTGEVVTKKEVVNLLDRTSDAHLLSSGTPMEKLYADHSNKLKSLANEARLAAVKTPTLKYSPSANKTYNKEVSSILGKLALAERNAPRERQAIVIANAKVRAKRIAKPDLEDSQITKIRFQALEEARLSVGAGKPKIYLEQDEWDAIQAGAISDNRLSRILRHADVDRVRELATPRRENLMTTNTTARALQMLASGYTRSEVASRLGVSLTTLDNATTATTQ